MGAFDPPGELVSAILDGRCIAFVGAGFSAGVMPTWDELIALLAQRLELGAIPREANAFHYEGVGQHLADTAKDRWEPLVREVLAEKIATASPEARAQLDQRREHLLQIPFRAILTTNFDPSLPTTHEVLGPSVYGSVLRRQRSRWWNAPAMAGHHVDSTPVIKLHGDANGDPSRLPLVLGRLDYRRRIYEDRNYANFIRSVFAEYTVLFLGVSFTDAYLNELRSEVLHLVHERGASPPWGYAIMYRPTPIFTEFLQNAEGIKVLETQQHSEFDQWLAALADRTSIAGRLRRLLDRKRIVWVDPNHETNNEQGHLLLGQAATIHSLDSPDQLDETTHANADVILTSFGHANRIAFRLLDRVRSWTARPPVVVFASPDATEEQLQSNRRECMRSGAWEYTTHWSELYRAIELLVGRVPGKPDRY